MMVFDDKWMYMHKNVKNVKFKFSIKQTTTFRQFSSKKLVLRIFNCVK